MTSDVIALVAAANPVPAAETSPAERRQALARVLDRRPRKAFRGPRRTGVLILALVTAAIVAGPAVALGLRYLGLFEGDPAPPRVRDSMARGSRLLGTPGRPDVERAVRVVTVRTRSGGDAAIYVAPVPGGGLCWFVEHSRGRERSGALGCEPTLEPPAGRQLAVGVGSGSFPGVLIDGRVGPLVASVELRFRDGSVLPLALTKRFFLAEIDPSRLAGKRRFWRVIARDARGAVVATQSLRHVRISPRPLPLRTTCPGCARRDR